jgi:hypothetical protein
VLGTSADGYIYVNNRYADLGPESVRTLRELIEAPDNA